MRLYQQSVEREQHFVRQLQTVSMETVDGTVDGTVWMAQWNLLRFDQVMRRSVRVPYSSKLPQT
jgi:hypothetical protein